MRRVTYFDGLRGFAAMQVVAEHYSRAFAPTWADKLGFVVNGQCAVHLFFLMSGFVLTGSFERAPFNIATHVLRRMIRLGVPVLVATAVAGVIVVISGGITHEVVKANGSVWLDYAAGHHTLSGFLLDLSQANLLTGHRETTLFRLRFLPSLGGSVDAPVWSMHLELWGSVWILALVALRAWSRRAYLLALALSVPVLGVTTIALFTIGHLTSLATRHDWTFSRIPPWLLTPSAFMLLTFGIALSSATTLNLRIVPCGRQIPSILSNFSWADLQQEAGAIAIFLSLVTLPYAQRLLNTAIPRFLGSISFPLYLVHWPIMISFSSLIYLQVRAGLSPLDSLLITFTTGMAVTIPVAMLFERYVDQPVVAAERSLSHNHHVTESVDTIGPI